MTQVVTEIRSPAQLPTEEAEHVSSSEVGVVDGVNVESFGLSISGVIDELSQGAEKELVSGRVGVEILERQLSAVQIAVLWMRHCQSCPSSVHRFLDFLTLSRARYQ